MKRRSSRLRRDRRIRTLQAKLSAQTSRANRFQALFEEEHRIRMIVERLSRTDHLTGVSTRQSFEEARDRLDGDPGITIILFDGSRVGQVNKRLGHNEGDNFIREIAKCITESVELHSSSTVRQIWRVGGDEFVVAINGSNEDAAAIVGHARSLLEFKELDRNMKRSPVAGLEAGWGPTFSEADKVLRYFKSAYRRQGEEAARRKIKFINGGTE